MLLDLISFYLSGVIASFTPCVIVIYPIVLYRFIDLNKSTSSSTVKNDKGSKEVKVSKKNSNNKSFINDSKKKNIANRSLYKRINLKEYLLFIIGFLASFILIGFSLKWVFSSSIKNGIQFGLGFLLIVIGFLDLFNLLKNINFKATKNSFFFGFIFSFAVSLSPCSLPFFVAVVSTGFAFNIFLGILLFGLGILTPAFIFLFTTQSLFKFINKSKKFTYYFSKTLSVIIIITGIYLALKTYSLQLVDLYISLLILIFVILFIFFSFSEVGFKGFLNLPRLFLLISIILFLLAFSYNCSKNSEFYKGNIKDSYFSNILPKEQESLNNAPSCGYEVLKCNICLKCFELFSVAIVFSFLGNYLIGRVEKKRNRVS